MALLTEKEKNDMLGIASKDNLSYNPTQMPEEQTTYYTTADNHDKNCPCRLCQKYREKNCSTCSRRINNKDLKCPLELDARNECVRDFWSMWEPFIHKAKLTESKDTIKKNDHDTEELIKGHNNGGSTDYYKFYPTWTDCQDVIESRSMNFSQGNIFKVAFCFNVGRHSAVTYERELNKIIWFAQRELERVKKD